ncbi:MAG TPA: DUF6474 family protein [Pseudonocardiaceae bacterium]|nr:DUF6474 family protein [Pseudonocardiaceae bacterium]
MRITPRNAKRAIGIAKVVVPLAVPLAFQAAAYTRDRWDRAKAHRLGVPVERLGEFSGRGGALHVRIANLTAAVGELQVTRPDQAHPDQTEFADGSARRLGDLAAAVRAAEQMPRGRRRATHQAVATELDLVEAGLLDRLGVSRTGVLRN